MRAPPRAKDAATLAEFPPGVSSRTASGPTLCDRACEHFQALCSIASPDRVPTIRYAWARSGSPRVDPRLAYRLQPRRDHARTEDTRTTHIVQLDEPASGGPEVRKDRSEQHGVARGREARPQPWAGSPGVRGARAGGPPR